MKKNLNTLVDDIYSMISSLGEDKKIKISEKEYEAFGKAMEKASQREQADLEKAATEEALGVGQELDIGATPDPTQAELDAQQAEDDDQAGGVDSGQGTGQGTGTSGSDNDPDEGSFG